MDATESTTRSTRTSRKKGRCSPRSRAELVQLLREGHDVVVDHGLWRRQDRDSWRMLAESTGGDVRLLYFPVPKEELMRRLNSRNAEGHANALPVTAEALDDFCSRFDEPDGEGEQVIAAGSF
jgi:predicted kinase